MRAITARLVVLVLGVFSVASCSSSPEKSSSSVTTVLVTAASFATVVATTTTTAVATTAPTVSPATDGPLLTPDDARLVADCVKFIPVGAILADQEATDLWDIAGRDYDELTDLCATLLTTAPATLASLSLKLTAFEMAQEATTTTTPATTTTTGGAVTSTTA